MLNLIIDVYGLLTTGTIDTFGQRMLLIRGSALITDFAENLASGMITDESDARICSLYTV